MRRVLTLLLCCSVALIVLLFSACKDANEEPTENGGKVEVKDDDGNLTGYERRAYNDNGDVTRLDVFDKDDVYQYYILYEYDGNNRLYTETRYKAEGFAEYRYVYSYDDDGNLTEKAYELPHGEAEVYHYDTEGNEIERLYYGADEQLEKREALENGKWVTYDAAGKIVK